MTIYTFHVEGLNREVPIKSTSRTEAHATLWKRLTDDERDRVVSIECVDEQPSALELQVPRLIHRLRNAGREPDSLYLGAEEAEELHEFVRDTPAFYEHLNDRAKPLKFMGLSVYVVKAETHLSVTAP